MLANIFQSLLPSTLPPRSCPICFTCRGATLFLSERTRAVIEDWAPGQVEFIPVTCHAKPKITAVLGFDSAYYFINVLGRAQRLQWLEVPTDKWPPQDD